MDRQPKEGLVGDKSTPLILTALSRAAADPAGLPLHSTKALPGLFPTTTVGKQAAKRCQDEGYLSIVRPDNPGGSPGTAAAKKTVVSEVCVLTDKGLAFLLSQVSPRHVLEDLVRVLEARRNQVGEWVAHARQMQASLDALKTNADKVLQQVQQAEKGATRPGLNVLFAEFLQGPEVNGTIHEQPLVAPLEASVLEQLARWQGSGAPEDCPLPELFRKLTGVYPGLSIGHFHDCLRRLHDAAQIYLHPWTGPLYAIAEPSYVLLVGHELAYYASLR
jgi:hypothetical protein